MNSNTFQSEYTRFIFLIARYQIYICDIIAFGIIAQHRRRLTRVRHAQSFRETVLFSRS